MSRRSRTRETDAIWHSFGKWIRENRNQARLNQTEVAKKIGVHSVHLSRIETGKTGTTREIVIALAKVLNLELREALNKAGMDQPGEAVKRTAIEEELLKYFNRLPFSGQMDLLTIAEALWRRQAIEIKERSGI